MTLTSLIINGKIQKKTLTLELDKNEDIYNCIKEAMQTNNIKKAELVLLEGEILDASLNYFLKNTHKNKKIQKIKIENYSGYFEISNKSGLFGNIKLSFKENNRLNNYTLVKGFAENGLKIKLLFFELNQ